MTNIGLIEQVLGQLLRVERIKQRSDHKALAHFGLDQLHGYADSSNNCKHAVSTKHLSLPIYRAIL